MLTNFFKTHNITLLKYFNNTYKVLTVDIKIEALPEYFILHYELSKFTDITIYYNINGITVIGFDRRHKTITRAILFEDEDEPFFKNIKDCFFALNLNLPPGHYIYELADDGKVIPRED